MDETIRTRGQRPLLFDRRPRAAGRKRFLRSYSAPLSASVRADQEFPSHFNEAPVLGTHSLTGNITNVAVAPGHQSTRLFQISPDSHLARFGIERLLDKLYRG